MKFVRVEDELLKKTNIVNFDLVTKRISNNNSILKRYLAIIQKQ